MKPGAVLISSVDAEALAREHIRNGYFMRGSVATGLDAGVDGASGRAVTPSLTFEWAFDPQGGLSLVFTRR